MAVCACQCVEVRCSALQCVAVRCSSLQCVALNRLVAPKCLGVTQTVAVRCSALQCVEVCCRYVADTCALRSKSLGHSCATAK